ncbi:MAG TPA: MFS transporter [Candidatus Binatia bacterium]|nr:MFS transporter [Candidatus Binatia bacterium]
MTSAILAQRAFLRATVMNFFFFTSLNGFVLLPLHIARLGGSEVEIGLVMAGYSALGIFCQPLVGPWVDVVGRRPFLLLGVLLLVVSAVMAALSGGIPGLALARALQGVAFSVFFVANFSHVLDLVPPAQRGWALGIYGVSGLLSSAVAPLIGEWTIRRVGFRPLFVGCAVVAGVAGVLAWSTTEQRRDPGQPVRGSEWMRAGLEDLVQLPMAVTVFFGLGTGVVFAFLPTFAESLGVGVLSLFYTAYAGAAMAVRILGGRLIDTRGRRAVIVPSMFLQALAVAVLGALGLSAATGDRTVPVLPVLVLVGLLAGGAHGFLYPGLAALVTDEAPAARRGAVVGVFSAVFLAGNAGGAFVFGHVAHAGGYGVMWTALAGLLLVGALLSLRLPGGATGPRPAAKRGLY